MRPASRSARGFLVGAVAAACLWSGVGHAQSPSSDACVSAYESNQQLRQDGKLLAAKEALLVCVQQSCPAFVRPDCEKWLGEVNQQMPSMVIAAKGADGSDVVDVKVFVDGQEVAATLDGRPIDVDPGPHELRFEYAGGTETMKVVIAQAMKSRVIEVRFGGGGAPVPAPVPGVAPSPNPMPGSDSGAGDDRGQPILAYVFGGLSLGAFAAFAALGTIGRSEADDLDAQCASTGCTQDEIDSVQTKLVAADVSLGIGAGLFAVGLGLFIYHYASDPDPTVAGLRIDAGPLPGGGMGQLTVPF